ncbi:PAS domain S-box protein [Solidesulfovibrio magneticus]|uniref:histidine kinase n=1 Tax=Solidesulfovibrio magneticus (strain ATCC 700980 / DSM 13731 / RS-1) TaxID=573370 RepID=C4XTY8_SOLM1|nr:PAS domain S-box protein [Solidesulfovibrio magneticus]BAH73653.1 two-component hybrid sensor and regulator [Solidesulfovibrio magneticus RS-1]
MVSDESKTSQQLLAELDAARARISQLEHVVGSVENKWNNTLINAPQIVISLDPSGKIIFANNHYFDLTGWNREELLGRNWFDTCIPEVVRDEIRGIFNSSMTRMHDHDYSTYENDILRRNGECLTVAWFNVLTLDSQGLPLDVTCMGVDVTERRRSEIALKESEQRFRNLFENAPLAYQSLDENGRFLDVNRKWLESLGYEDKVQVLGKWFGDFLAPDYKDHFDINFPMFKQACVIDGVEFEMLRMDGGRITVSFNGRVQADREGNFIRTHCIFTDITERRRAEDKLHVTAERLRLANKATNDVIWDWDVTQDTQQWNEAGTAVFGWTEIVARPVSAHWWVDRVHPDDRERVNDSFFSVVNNPEIDVWHDEYRFMKADGTYADVIDRGYLLRDGQGKPIRMIGAMQDITERKQAEASLNSIKWLVDKEVRPALAPEASEYGDLVQLNNSRVILNAVGSDILANMVQDYMEILSTSSAVYEINGDYAFGIFASGWCKTMDQASRRLCGCTTNAEALASGKWLCHESCWSEASLTAIETRQPADIACTGGIRLYAVPIKSGDAIVGAVNFGYGTPPRDRKVIAELAALYQVDPDELWKLSMEYEHRPDFIIDTAKQRLKTTARLIGEMVSRSMVEQDLQKATHLAETANRAKSEFLANMSHEIRTPLNGVLGMLQLLETTDQTDEQKEYLFGAISSTKRLTRLLSDILDISRIEAGRMEIVEVEFNIKKTRDSIKELFNPEAKGKGLRLEFGRDEDLPLVLVGDEARLRQILFNLVGNAIKFTEKGEIRIDASLLPSSSDSHVRVLVTVRDTGIGIPEEHLKGIFEPFVQAEASYTRRFQGAGLGLSIVRRLVKLMGGDISIDSTVGEGTTVYLSLPFKLPKTEQKSVEIASDDPSPVHVSSRILVAEDDTISLITAKRMLEKSGYSVSAAKNGQEALQRLTEESFDLILMDVQMPIMDGVEATKAIRGASNLGAKSSVPIVAMTAYAMTGDKETFLAAGMDDYISKPVDKAALAEVIERVLSLKRNTQ